MNGVMSWVMCDGWWRVSRCETKDNLIVLFLRPPTTPFRSGRRSRAARAGGGAVRRARTDARAVWAFLGGAGVCRGLAWSGEHNESAQVRGVRILWRKDFSMRRAWVVPARPVGGGGPTLRSPLALSLWDTGGGEGVIRV